MKERDKNMDHVGGKQVDTVYAFMALNKWIKEKAYQFLDINVCAL